MTKDFERVLIEKDVLEEKVKELAGIINKDYKGKDLIVITILKGGVMFAVDLLKHITIPVEIDFMAVSSYGASSKSSGVVKIVKDLNASIENKHVLILEDIVDSGLTLSYLKDLLISRNPESVKICTILSKPARRKIDIYVDYIGFEIPDEYVVGYGLDYNEKYRNLPYIAVLKREIYS